MSAATADDRAESIRMIRDSAAAVAPPGADLGRIRALRFTDPGFDRAVLAQLGEMGWLGLRLPEAQGGAALGLGEACALAEELGAALVPEPLVAAMLSAAVLAAAGAKLDDVVAGRHYLPLAWQDRANTLDIAAGRDAPRCFVPMAAGADGYLVPVREAGRLALYRATGEARIERTQDGGNLGSFVPVLGERLAADIALDALLDEAALLSAAYLLGGMERAFAMTLDYLRTRSQFGRIIGTFQALQHRAADLKMHLAMTRASVESAAAALDAGAAGDARRAAVSRAKARAAEAGLLVTRQCIQLHGGIGYTDQYDVGLYLRKAMVVANQYGSATLHRRRFMATAPEGDE